VVRPRDEIFLSARSYRCGIRKLLSPGNSEESFSYSGSYDMRGRRRRRSEFATRGPAI